MFGVFIYTMVVHAFFSFIYFILYNCFVPLVFLPWEIRVAFPGESQPRQSGTTHPTVHAGCFSVSIILHSDVDYRFFNGFRARRSNTEQIFSLRILCEKYVQHQQDLYHVFIDFKKAFDRVWHAALWATMKKYNISTNLIQVIKNLYNKATIASSSTAA